MSRNKTMWILGYTQQEAYEMVPGLTYKEEMHLISSAFRSYQEVARFVRETGTPEKLVQDARNNVRAMIDAARWIIFRPR